MKKRNKQINKVEYANSQRCDAQKERKQMATYYEISSPHFQSNKLSVRTSLLSSAKLQQNGGNLKKTKGTYQAIDDQGNTVEIKMGFDFLNLAPNLEIKNETIYLFPRMKWYIYAWVYLPLFVLFFQGGAIGALIAIIGVTQNLKIFRSQKPIAVKFVITGFIAALVWVFYIVIIILPWFKFLVSKLF